LTKQTDSIMKEHDELLTRSGLMLRDELENELARLSSLLSKAMPQSEDSDRSRAFWALKKSLLEEGKESLTNQIITGKFNC
jgi:hypothetical protein